MAQSFTHVATVQFCFPSDRQVSIRLAGFISGKSLQQTAQPNNNDFPAAKAAAKVRKRKTSIAQSGRRPMIGMDAKFFDRMNTMNRMGNHSGNSAILTKKI